MMDTTKEKVLKRTSVELDYLIEHKLTGEVRVIVFIKDGGIASSKVETSEHEIHKNG